MAGQDDCCLQGMQEAEKKTQAQLEAMKAERQRAVEQLRAAHSERHIATAQLEEDRQAASQKMQTMQEEVQTAQQRLQAVSSDCETAAKQLQNSRLAYEKERADWQQQREEWEAERSAKAEREQQLQRDMAAMQAMLEQYKAALQSGTPTQNRAEAANVSMSKGEASGQLLERSKGSSEGVPAAAALLLTPHTPRTANGESDDVAQPTQQVRAASRVAGQEPKNSAASMKGPSSLDACTPAPRMSEFEAASGVDPVLCSLLHVSSSVLCCTCFSVACCASPCIL